MFDPQNAVLASTIVKANGNANGKAGAYLSGTNKVFPSRYLIEPSGGGKTDRLVLYLGHNAAKNEQVIPSAEIPLPKPLAHSYLKPQ